MIPYCTSQYIKYNNVGTYHGAYVVRSIIIKLLSKKFSEFLRTKYFLNRTYLPTYFLKAEPTYQRTFWNRNGVKQQWTFKYFNQSSFGVANELGL